MTSDRSPQGSGPRRWLDRLIGRLGREPQDQEQLRTLLREAKKRALFDSDALGMMEGVLEVAELRVRDIMIPRAQTVVVGREDALDEVLPGFH